MVPRMVLKISLSLEKTFVSNTKPVLDFVRVAVIFPIFGLLRSTKMLEYSEVCLAWPSEKACK